jgi:hypothetical protein
MMGNNEPNTLNIICWRAYAAPSPETRKGAYLLRLKCLDKVNCHGKTEQGLVSATGALRSHWSAHYGATEIATARGLHKHRPPWLSQAPRPALCAVNIPGPPAHQGQLSSAAVGFIIWNLVEIEPGRAMIGLLANQTAHM